MLGASNKPGPRNATCSYNVLSKDGKEAEEVGVNTMAKI
jgi:hypothetical protein